MSQPRVSGRPPLLVLLAVILFLECAALGVATGYLIVELVTNAVEHGLAGREGTVEIIAERTDEMLTVLVRDNGSGLPEGKVGSGLGTQIVRTLIQGELSGTIDWHTMMGDGTEVTIEIPLTWLTKPKARVAV